MLVAIIMMSIMFGAELGPKADPTTTTYVPRPEWYFFFLFEVLRVIKPAVLTPLATIGVPTLCMVLLFLLPFVDRGPERRPERRPIATMAGILDDRRDGLPHLPRRRGGLAERDRPEGRRKKYEAGKLVVAQSGCLACHKIGENGNDGPGSEPDRNRRQAAQGRDPRGRSRTRRRRCRRSPACRRRRRPRWSTSSRSCTASSADALDGVPAGPYGHPGGGTGARDVRPHRGRLRPHELGDDRRAAPPLARAGRRPRRARRPATARSTSPTGTGDLAIELARRVAPGGERDRHRLLRADARARPREVATRCRWEWADALALPYEDDSFDAATVGFGARNFSDLDRGLAEMARVVQPGGRVVMLEITTPQKPPALVLLLALVRPDRARCSGKLAGDPDAYAYLPSSVKRFPGPEALGGAAGRRGLTDVRWILTAGGIIAIHAGTVR